MRTIRKNANLNKPWAFVDQAVGALGCRWRVSIPHVMATW